MRRLAALALLAISVAAGCVLWPEGSGPAASPLSLDEALRLQARGEAVLVDVRSREAYAAGHVPGAVNMPATEILDHVAELRRTGKLPILYCG